MTSIIRFVAWVIAAVGKHIVSQQALPGGDEGVGVEEPAPLGVVITALEIIEPGLINTLLAAEPNLPLIEAYCLGKIG